MTALILEPQVAPKPKKSHKGQRVFLESSVLDEVLDYLERQKQLGAIADYWRFPNGVYKSFDGKRTVKLGGKGALDILVFLPQGMPLWIETKSTTGRLTAEQEQFIERMESIGVGCIVARSKLDLFERLKAVVG